MNQKPDEKVRELRPGDTQVASAAKRAEQVVDECLEAGGLETYQQELFGKLKLLLRTIGFGQNAETVTNSVLSMLDLTAPLPNGTPPAPAQTEPVVAAQEPVVQTVGISPKSALEEVEYALSLRERYALKQSKTRNALLTQKERTDSELEQAQLQFAKAKPHEAKAAQAAVLDLQQTLARQEDTLAELNARLAANKAELENLKAYVRAFKLVTEKGVVEEVLYASFDKKDLE